MSSKWLFVVVVVVVYDVFKTSTINNDDDNEYSNSYVKFFFSLSLYVCISLTHSPHFK